MPPRPARRLRSNKGPGDSRLVRHATHTHIGANANRARLATRMSKTRLAIFKFQQVSSRSKRLTSPVCRQRTQDMPWREAHPMDAAWMYRAVSLRGKGNRPDASRLPFCFDELSHLTRLVDARPAWRGSTLATAAITGWLTPRIAVKCSVALFFWHQLWRLEIRTGNVPCHWRALCISKALPKSRLAACGLPNSRSSERGT